ncbi:MAG: hypothetical protein J0M00_01955 [Burkholderiales bacterium]|nr:hypothetical protein [Burkholderiales bacterium]
MRILLVNNASGVHEYLRRGLEANGHEVLLVVPGKGNYQSRAADAHFGVVGRSPIASFRRIVLPYTKLRSLGSFDVVNYHLGISLFSSPVTRYMDLKYLKSRGARLSYYALGCDEASLLRIREDVGDLPCQSCMEYDANGKNCTKLRLNRRPRASRSAPLFDFAVSAAYIYDHGLDFFPNARKEKIQFPIDISHLDFNPARAHAKPVIVHSPTKKGFKGTMQVLEAVDILRSKRDDFEFRLVQGLSHAEYLRTMRECDVYIDQIFSADSFGIAALENMACGKIVVSGNGPLGWGGFPFMRQAPVVRASMEPVLLAEIVSDLLDRKSEFPRIAQKAREYVKTHHDYRAVARRFVSLWSGESPPQTKRTQVGDEKVPSAFAGAS